MTLNLRDRVLGEVEIGLLPSQRGPLWTNALKTVCPTRGFIVLVQAAGRDQFGHSSDRLVVRSLEISIIRLLIPTNLGWCGGAQSCQTFWDRMDYILPGSSVCEIFQARILERVAISYSRGSSQHRD